LISFSFLGVFLKFSADDDNEDMIDLPPGLLLSLSDEEQKQRHDGRMNSGSSRILRSFADSFSTTTNILTAHVRALPYIEDADEIHVEPLTEQDYALLDYRSKWLADGGNLLRQVSMVYVDQIVPIRLFDDDGGGGSNNNNNNNNNTTMVAYVRVKSFVTRQGGVSKSSSSSSSSTRRSSTNDENDSQRNGGNSCSGIIRRRNASIWPTDDNDDENSHRSVRDDGFDHCDGAACTADTGRRTRSCYTTTCVRLVADTRVVVMSPPPKKEEDEERRSAVFRKLRVYPGLCDYGCCSCGKIDDGNDDDDERIVGRQQQEDSWCGRTRKGGQDDDADCGIVKLATHLGIRLIAMGSRPCSAAIHSKVAAALFGQSDCDYVDDRWVKDGNNQVLLAFAEPCGRFFSAFGGGNIGKQLFATTDRASERENVDTSSCIAHKVPVRIVVSDDVAEDCIGTFLNSLNVCVCAAPLKSL